MKQQSPPPLTHAIRIGALACSFLLVTACGTDTERVTCGWLIRASENIADEADRRGDSRVDCGSDAEDHYRELCDDVDAAVADCERELQEAQDKDSVDEDSVDDMTDASDGDKR